MVQDNIVSISRDILIYVVLCYLKEGIIMAAKKDKTVFFCQNCGHESAKWLGQCPMCHEWNCFVEEKVKPSKSNTILAGGKTAGTAHTQVLAINQVSNKKEDRTLTGIGEFDRVLGGGIVNGSMTLIGGDPGIGKSTLLLQVCQKLSDLGKKVLYISGEESAKQIKMRADRIGSFTDDMLLLCDTDLDEIIDRIKDTKPEIVVIDSIQTMSSDNVQAAPGSVSQVRETTAILMKVAKVLNISVFIVGHVTKEGTVAGPRVLEHMVDTVLYFEGDRHASYRILRGVKNRFGSTDEIGVFEMCESGLLEVKNPSEFMLSGRPENASGALVACCMEGSRCILLEVQALVAHTVFGYPRRQANGTDFNRLNLLMAVLEKRLELQISDYDAYVNVAGGMKITEPALDLPMIMAVVSSFRNKPLDDKLVAFGEVGLSGEVRSVSLAEQRVREAKKLGFTTCIMPYSNAVKLKPIDGIEVIGVKTVVDALARIR